MNDVINSCLMWAVNLETPVSLGCLFDSEDLKDTGIEIDSHITLLYAQGKVIDRKNLLEEIRDILGPDDYNWILEFIQGDSSYRVLDVFDLGCFENDSDYLVLKLRKETEVYKALSLINKSLSIKYGVTSDFAQYTPHITLAELQPGTVKKYLESDVVRLVLEDSVYNFEDLFISYGTANEPVNRKQYYLTNYKCLDRFFRLLRLKKEVDEL